MREKQRKKFSSEPTEQIEQRKLTSLLSRSAEKKKKKKCFDGEENSRRAEEEKKGSPFFFFRNSWLKKFVLAWALGEPLHLLKTSTRKWTLCTFYIEYIKSLPLHFVVVFVCCKCVWCLNCPEKFGSSSTSFFFLMKNLFLVMNEK